MYINKKTGASYGFVAPEIQEDERKDTRVPFPTFGIVNADIESEDPIEIDVVRTITVVDLGDEPLDANQQITLNASESLPQGSRCIVKFKNGGTQRNVTVRFFVDEDENEINITGISNQTVCKEIIFFDKEWHLLQ